MHELCIHKYDASDYSSTENSRLQANFGFSSVVVDLLFYVSRIGCGGSVLVFALVCITLCPF